MKAFKQYLIDSAYDLGLEDHLYVDEPSWSKVRKVDVFKLVDNYSKDLLTEYTEFLLKEGYCDSDVYCEPPTAIDRFMHKELRKK